jgi:hypothetical protein
MNWFRSFAMLALAVLWLPITMHCKLELVPGMDLLKTCCFVDSATSLPPDCDNDGCSAVEDGNYRTEQQTASAPQPLLQVACLPAVIAALMPAEERCNSPLLFPRPDIPNAWQFTLRAALPPRAPSIT